MVQAIHTAVKGRARYKVRGLYRSEPLKTHLEQRLSEKSQVTGFSVNILTGHVLVFFVPDLPHPAIGALLKSIVTEYIRLHQQGRTGEFTKAGPTPKPSNTQVTKPVAKNVRPSNAQFTKPALKNKIRTLVSHAEDQKADPWHLMETGNVLEALGSSGLYGLTGESAKANFKKYGPNLLPESVPRSGLSIFLDQFKSLPVALLGVAAGLSVFTGGVSDAILIAGVVLINAAIGYVTESQAEKTIDSLKSLVRPSASILRDGMHKEITAEEVVPGDIIVLRPGSYVAADSRILEADYLSIDESALTGESMPVIKNPAPLSGQFIPLADRFNMVYMGTLVTGGQGYAVVVATGRFTEIGKIQALVGEAKSPETPMERQLRVMGGQLVLISGAVCGLVFVIGLLRGYGFLAMLKSSISLAVAAVPEGLPTIATTTLALGIRRMRKHNVLIRHLEAVETLGSVQTISFDKTGTITMNTMSVVEVHTGMKRMVVSDGRFVALDGPVNPYEQDELLRLMHISVICNETEVTKKNDEYVLRGSSTENALVNLAISSGVDVMALRARHPLLKISHRSENRNFMSTLHGLPGGPKVLAVKGSPTEVLAMCDCHLQGGRKVRLTEEDRLDITTENERMAGGALRVLGAAYCNVSEGEDETCVKGGLVWLGLVGMADPVRRGVKDLMGVFQNAGIDTVMITGDQSPTAYAVGKELNLSGNGQLEILDSTHLADIDPEVLRALAKRVHVYARVSPAHKLQIVQALQASGKVVAMTGDGINDGPALKAADIGIALGHTGTDVAREVADIVLEDDNLETMVIAVSHGRTIYNNIRKSVHYLLATNLSEIMVMFTAVAFGMGQPLSAMQLLWINLLSDIFPGLALALEPPEPDILSRPPRDPLEPIVKRSDFKRIAFESATLSAGAFGAYGYGIARYGMGPRANTMAFASLTTGQLLHAISCRSESPVLFGGEKMPPNRYLNVAIGGSLALQVLAMAVPGVRRLLGVTPIGAMDALVVGGGALLPLLINEVTKKPREAPVRMPERHAPEQPDRDNPVITISGPENMSYETGLHVHVGVCD